MCVDLFSSSSSVYGNVSEENLPTPVTAPKNPLSPYGLQKLVGEQYCKLYSTIHNIDTVSSLFQCVWRTTTNQRRLFVGDGNFCESTIGRKTINDKRRWRTTRDFTYVGDVVSANIKASMSDKVGNGEILNVGNGDNRSVNDIAKMIESCRA